MGIVSAKTCGTGIKNKKYGTGIKPTEVRYRYLNKKYGTGIKTKDTVQVLKQKDAVPVLKTNDTGT